MPLHGSRSCPDIRSEYTTARDAIAGVMSQYGGYYIAVVEDITKFCYNYRGATVTAAVKTTASGKKSFPVQIAANKN